MTFSSVHVQIEFESAEGQMIEFSSHIGFIFLVSGTLTSGEFMLPVLYLKTNLQKKSTFMIFLFEAVAQYVAQPAHLAAEKEERKDRCSLLLV